MKHAMERLLERRKISDGGCWEYTGYRDRHGYGRVKFQGRVWPAHKLAWESANARRTPEGKLICHHCDNPPCFNPAHLYDGTPAQNNQDARQRGKGRTPDRPPKKRRRLLTEEQVIEIRKMYAEGMRSAEIAEKFQMNRCHITDIVFMRAWRNVQALSRGGK